MTARNAATFAIGLLVVLACAARIVHLDADPSFPTWIGYVADEGRWNETARNLALFGAPDASSYARMHLFLTPGYQAVNYVFFRVLGVEFWSARLFSAASGILILLVVLFALRKHVTTWALALGVVILGFEASMLAESRMALPEMPSTMMTLLLFLVLILGRQTTATAFLAGLICAAAVAMKGTTLLVLCVFPLIVYFSTDGDFRARIRQLLAFASGFVLVVLTALGAVLILGILTPEAMAYASRHFRWFLSLTGPYAMALRFLDSSEFEACNFMLLGAWICSWLWFHRDPRVPLILCRLYLASGAWAAWWLMVWSGNGYLPGRYIVHFIVPATIHLMAGLSLAGPHTLAAIVATLGRQRGPARYAVLAWLVLPSAILLASVAAGFAAFAGLDATRLAVRLMLIAMFVGAMVTAVSRRMPEEGWIRGLLMLPIGLTLIWLVGREMGWYRQLWPTDSILHAAIWATLSGLTIAVCAAWSGRPLATNGLAIVGCGAIAAITAVFFAQSASAILAPTFSIHDASQKLQQQLATATEIRTFNAESLFLANHLRFHTAAPNDSKFDALVIFEHGIQSRNFLAWGRAAHLVLVRRFPIAVNSRYELDEAKDGPASIAIFEAR